MTQVINQHRFGAASGGSLAVNGKEPIAAWVPSLDDAGDGTTTLTDLVGSSDGTLVNMDPSTDWVADTDAGGIAALDFDGVDDRVDVGSGFSFASDPIGAISAWCRWDGGNTVQILTKEGDSSSPAGFRNTIELRGISPQRVMFRVATSGIVLTAVTPDNSFPLGAWTHVALTVDELAGTRIAINGVDQALTFLAGSQADHYWFSDVFSASRKCVIGALAVYANTISGASDGRLDDIRIFSQVLTMPDIAYLYGGGNGRGVTAT